MNKTKFVHLHVHTEYSLLDGACRLKELLETAKEMGQHAIAITDHGSMSGLWEAQKLGEAIGIEVVLGCEFYYQREMDGGNGHLIVFAKNDKGLENMMKLQEFAYVHNFYKKPRIKWEILKEHAEGLIISSACLASSLDQYILKGDINAAKEWARKFQNTFGEDFYLEIQSNSLPEQFSVNKTIIKLSHELGIKVIATNDVHYIRESDSFPHEILLALQTNKKLSDEKRFKFDVNDFWLKSEEEMMDGLSYLDEVDVLDALNNTAEIVAKCSAKYYKGKYLPKFHTIPEGETERSLLVANTKKGLIKYEMAKDKEYVKATQEEINIIDRNGYSGYFLIVSDYVDAARNNSVIVGDGRGSGAGSKVAYLTGITKIEPTKYDLLFERFMADGREPDFDVDFSDQDYVFSYLQSKYGIENVARIIAFGTMTPKAVCRKVMNCFEHEASLIKKINNLIPNLCPNLEEAYKASPELLAYKKKYKTEFDVIERLEGIISHESQHAGGVIIYPNLSSILPIKTRSEDRTKRIAAFDKYMLAELGHFKFDILGLETLPVIKRTLDSIKEATGECIDLHNIDMEDGKVYDMLCQGDVSGIFQLSNQAGKVIEQKPRNFKDLIAINALIRPGTGDWQEYIARRKGKTDWKIHHDRLSYLKETEGLITYQEQFLLDCKVLAGWSIAFADKHVRKNKSITTDDDLMNKFYKDCVANGIDIKDAVEIWNEIQSAVAGGYSFNKSHSASYAVISYQTAYLKCHYPEHFYASLMSSEKTDGDGQSAIAGYISECKQRNIRILPPDINNSSESFMVSNGEIKYRITTIKHVGESAINHILRNRPYESFNNFMDKREKQYIKQNVLVNLIKAGCFDFDEPNRAKLLWELDMQNRSKTQIKNNYTCPQYEWNDRVKAEWEREVLGMYLSIHPMERYGFKPLSDFPDEGNCLQGGEVYDIRIFKDKRDREMAFAFINTLFGNVKVLIFASQWKNEKIRETIKLNSIIMVKGRRSGDSVILNEVEELEC
jgi:DNA polymerase-3 subunit alpha